jgi:hypothetical protein
VRWTVLVPMIAGMLVHRWRWSLACAVPLDLELIQIHNFRLGFPCRSVQCGCILWVYWLGE